MLLIQSCLLIGFRSQLSHSIYSTEFVSFAISMLVMRMPKKDLDLLLQYVLMRMDRYVNVNILPLDSDLMCRVHTSQSSQKYIGKR